MLYKGVDDPFKQNTPAQVSPALLVCLFIYVVRAECTVANRLVFLFLVIVIMYNCGE